MRKSWLIWGLVLAILAIVILNRVKSKLEKAQPLLVIRNQKILVEVARTRAEISRGLSNRADLAENRGMLFILGRTGTWSFWMKGMRFGLDFVFFRDDKVVDLVKNVPFPQNGEAPQMVYAKAAYDKVLEMKAGGIERLGIEIGDQASFSF
jgi:uncharacterized membrane protein (UPF0127 family)